jgi:hypothetical protein
MARENVCWKHTETKAVARCMQCSKPICKACIVESNGDQFCSTACVSRNAEFKERNPAGAPKKGGFGAVIMRLIALVVFIVALIVVADKVLHLPFARTIMQKIGF